MEIKNRPTSPGWGSNFPRSGKQLPQVTSQGLGSNFPRSLPKIWGANSTVSHFIIKIIFFVFPKVASQGLGSNFPRSLPTVWEASFPRSGKQSIISQLPQVGEAPPLQHHHQHHRGKTNIYY